APPAVDDRLASLTGIFAPGPAAAVTPPAQTAPKEAEATAQAGDAWAAPGQPAESWMAPTPATTETPSNAWAPNAPAEPAQAPETAWTPSPPPREAPAPESGAMPDALPPAAPRSVPPSPGVLPPTREQKKSGLFGMFRREEPAPLTQMPRQAQLGSRVGTLASFSNALLAEYSSGSYGRGQVESRMANLLMRVHEQAEPLDHRGGIVHEAPNVVGFIDYPLGPRLAEELGVAAIYLDRDTIMAAVGEAVAGAARGARNFIYVTISTGIGGAIVIDGRLLRGAANTAGEIGHFPVALEGPRCGCGSYGCVESLAAGRFVAEAYGVDDAARVYAAAAAGDEAAERIVTRAEKALGNLAVGLA